MKVRGERAGVVEPTGPRRESPERPSLGRWGPWDSGLGPGSGSGHTGVPLLRPRRRALLGSEEGAGLRTLGWEVGSLKLPAPWSS